jgi:chromosomal replication initiation ATPase DnaA
VKQLYLEFPIKPKYFTEDFFITSANQKVIDIFKKWPDWGAEKFANILYIYGEHGSGKTHLAYIWKNISSAKILGLNDLHNLYYKERCLILENIEKINQETLLHLINIAEERHQFLLLTSSFSPANLKITLPDLRSRILSLPSMGIDSPDSDLLKAVLLKHISDRNLQINSVAVDYLIPRIDRSFTKLLHTINKLESFSKINKRPITIPLIKEALGS